MSYTYIMHIYRFFGFDLDFVLLAVKHYEF